MLMSFFRTPVVAALLLLCPLVVSAQIREIIDSTGDGTNPLDGIGGVAVDASGNVYVSGLNTDNLFRIAASTSCSTTGTPCAITEIIDDTGDGSIVHDRSSGVAVDSAGNVYLVGQFSDNVWRITNPTSCSTGGTPCSIAEIISPSGDGVHGLDNPTAIAVDGSDNVYVVGGSTDNVFRIAASTTCSTGGTPCSITEIADSTGDGTNAMDQPAGVGTDSAGNVFVTTQNSNNVFKIATPGSCSTGGTVCTITEILDTTGDGVAAFVFGRGVIADSAGNVYATGLLEGRVFRVATPGTCSTSGTPCSVTLLTDQVSPGQALNLAFDADDNIFFSGGNGDNALKIDQPGGCSVSGTPCTVTEVIGPSGDGSNILDGSSGIALSGFDMYVAGGGSDNAFRVGGVAVPFNLIFADGFESNGTGNWSSVAP